MHNTLKSGRAREYDIFAGGCVSCLRQPCQPFCCRLGSQAKQPCIRPELIQSIHSPIWSFQVVAVTPISRMAPVRTSLAAVIASQITRANTATLARRVTWTSRTAIVRIGNRGRISGGWGDGGAKHWFFSPPPPHFCGSAYWKGLVISLWITGGTFGVCLLPPWFFQ